ncbi:lycopene cyclase domain-containing protein [Homoserinimonas aerilata]|uniref:Lycopene cyclase domain-containing protein n=1 Tax=Homoserinimonas aerilata TaxID=1162970 RepID=A0A542YF58_9MICO|nr:lycopene cyclase domain-containing protein [Homoserinimonas aerilata]TQL46723.1 lycopene cyclase domain-containing protein [Homoserinimonas aerilata]
MGLIYLGALLTSLGCMVLLDRRFGLFFWRDRRRATIVLASGLVFFIVWDLFGIGLDIFFRGETDFMTGILLAPELPLEEPFFLALLCYLSMNAYGALTHRDAGRPRAGRGTA